MPKKPPYFQRRWTGSLGEKQKNKEIKKFGEQLVSQFIVLELLQKAQRGQGPDYEKNVNYIFRAFFIFFVFRGQRRTSDDPRKAFYIFIAKA